MAPPAFTPVPAPMNTVVPWIEKPDGEPSAKAVAQVLNIGNIMWKQIKVSCVLASLVFSNLQEMFLEILWVSKA